MPKYEAFYQNKRATVDAASLYAAKLAAVALFKPRKSQEHMVSVVLVARDDGSPVWLNQSNADLG